MSGRRFPARRKTERQIKRSSPGFASGVPGGTGNSPDSCPNSQARVWLLCCLRKPQESCSSSQGSQEPTDTLISKGSASPSLALLGLAQDLALLPRAGFHASALLPPGGRWRKSRAWFCGREAEGLCGLLASDRIHSPPFSDLPRPLSSSASDCSL